MEEVLEQLHYEASPSKHAEIRQACIEAQSKLKILPPFPTVTP